MVESFETLASEIAEALPGGVIRYEIAHGELTLHVVSDEIVRVATVLRDDLRFDFKLLMDACGVDYPERDPRFEMVYHLLSLTKNRRIRLTVHVDEHTAIPSLVSVYPSVGWFEREAFDMFGIRFSDHPDLRRILTDYGFSGHPLRKDFPLSGFVEVRYDDEIKRVVYGPVELPQAFRAFDYLSPWEGAKYILPGDEKAAETKK